MVAHDNRISPMSLASAEKKTGNSIAALSPPGSVQEALRYGREHDWIGHHVATVLAMIYLFLLPLATMPKDAAFGVLAGWTLIRLPHTWRSFCAFKGMPIAWGLLAWVGWQALSFTWSHNLSQAWDELKVQRMLVTPLLLWPILDRAPWLVMAALAGALAQNGVQVMQELGWLAVHTSGEGRLRGLIHPIHSAMWFGVAMVWHLSAILNTRGRWRWASLLLLVISAAGLIATGSRGPWIGTAVALFAAMIVIPLRRPKTLRAALILAMAGTAGLVITWILGQGMIRPRLAEAQHEINEARHQEVYWTSAGLRLGLWSWAAEVWRSSPIIGVGAGGFPQAYQSLDSFHHACEIARDRSMREEVDGYDAAVEAGRDVTRLRGYKRGMRLYDNRFDYLTRDHAHSTYMHALASEGLVGFLLIVVVLLIIAWQCWNDRSDHPYSDGMLFTLICWIVGALFDCYELNGHQLGLIALVAALTLPGRPRVRWKWSAIGD